jgi:serine protease Do
MADGADMLSGKNNRRMRDGFGARLRPGAIFLLAAALCGAGATMRELRPKKSDPTRATSKGAKLPEAPPVKLARRADLPEVFLKPVPTSIEDLKKFEARTESLVKRVSGAVVAVELRGGTGSGVVISKDGMVLTAAHVCGEPFLDVTIRFPDGTTAKGKTLGTDHDMDAGLVQITDKGTWPHAEMGEMAQVRPGDWVLALGHPGGYDKTRTTVARLGRILRFRGEAIQTDCTLIGGDSGGPLFDMHGRVIGIHSRISNSTTENYHVPIDAYAEGWNQLADGASWGEDEAVPVTWVGARCADREEGCRVEHIYKGSPAAQANLKIGDIVQSMNGKSVTNYNNFVLLSMNAGYQEGGESPNPDRDPEAKLKIKREGKELEVTVKYGFQWLRRFSRGR